MRAPSDFLARSAHKAMATFAAEEVDAFIFKTINIILDWK